MRYEIGAMIFSFAVAVEETMGAIAVLWEFCIDFRASHLLDRKCTFNFSGKWIIVLPERFIIVVASDVSEWPRRIEKLKRPAHHGNVAPRHCDLCDLYGICFFSLFGNSFGPIVLDWAVVTQTARQQHTSMTNDPAKIVRVGQMNEIRTTFAS